MIDLLFKPAGRIGRKTFWIANLSALAVMIVAVMLSVPLLSDSLRRVGDSIDIGTPAIIMMVALYLPIALVVYMVSAKRLHDLNVSGWLLLPVFGLSIIPFILQPELITLTPDAAATAKTQTVKVLDVINGLIGLALIILLGFMKGTDGPNKFGADPLAPLDARMETA